MPTPTKGPRLGGGPAHERLILANLATSLFEHDRITTTEAKAKRLRPLAEKLITFAKRGDLHARRRVMTVIRDKDVVHKLFAEIGPNYTERPGGYTRIIKTNPRKGDNAPMAIIELVESVTAAQSVVTEAEKSRGTRFARRNAPTGRTAEIAEDTKADSPTSAAVASEAAQADAVDAVDARGTDATTQPGTGASAVSFADEADQAQPHGEAHETAMPVDDARPTENDLDEPAAGVQASQPAEHAQTGEHVQPGDENDK